MAMQDTIQNHHIRHGRQRQYQLVRFPSALTPGIQARASEDRQASTYGDCTDSLLSLLLIQLNTRLA